MQVPKGHPSDRHIWGDARSEWVTSVAAASLAETMQVDERGLTAAATSYGKMQVLKGIRPVTPELQGSRNRPSHI